MFAALFSGLAAILSYMVATDTDGYLKAIFWAIMAFNCDYIFYKIYDEEARKINEELNI